MGALYRRSWLSECSTRQFMIQDGSESARVVSNRLESARRVSRPGACRVGPVGGCAASQPIFGVSPERKSAQGAAGLGGALQTAAGCAEGRPAEDTVTPCTAAISLRRSASVSRRVVHPPEPPGRLQAAFSLRAAGPRPNA